MALEVKICGIASAEAADTAVRAEVNFAGVVFHRSSPRNVRPDQARQLATRMRGRVRIVALLVDPLDEEIEVALAAAKPDFIQLHGCETPQRVAELRARLGIPIIKSIAVADAGDVAGAAAYEEVADMLLFDAKLPLSASRPGGHGISFDWQLLRGRIAARPWFLAGGLTASNVARAISVASPSGVDVSSGVETAPGVKDPHLIREFIAAARAQNAARAECR